MITLNMSPQEQAVVEQASQAAGMSVERYIISKVVPAAHDTTARMPKTLADLVAGKQLSCLNEDPVALQQAMRNDWR